MNRYSYNINSIFLNKLIRAWEVISIIRSSSTNALRDEMNYKNCLVFLLFKINAADTSLKSNNAY